MMRLSKQMKKILFVLSKEFPNYNGDGTTLHNWHNREIMKELGLEVTPSREASFSRTMKKLQKEGLVESYYRCFTHGKVFQLTDKGIEFVKVKIKSHLGN